MRFGTLHKHYFGAVDGAYSEVTKREEYDSQITLVGEEATIVNTYLGFDSILVGNVRSDPEKAAKKFMLYPNYDTVELNLVFPKPDKPELRLYLKTDIFKPSAGQIWFIFRRKDRPELCIGAMDRFRWMALGQVDEIDHEYQEEIARSWKSSSPDHNAPPVIRESSTQVYVRDPVIAWERFRLSDYRCEYNSEHETFISARTGLGFVEAHHLIPMQYQPLFEVTLDSVENIVALCPNCHRAVHYSMPDMKRKMLQQLVKSHGQIFHTYLIDRLALFGFYNCLAPEDYD